jgi:hypothetical protein
MSLCVVYDLYYLFNEFFLLVFLSDYRLCNFAFFRPFILYYIPDSVSFAVLGAVLCHIPLKNFGLFVAKLNYFELVEIFQRYVFNFC